ncbi:MAG: hypothetical protein K8J08_03500 [Thermoanaerobaculia bacterium]|nr:hypothetical protein [Thermoanaerobaculia bacterium]
MTGLLACAGPPVDTEPDLNSELRTTEPAMEPASSMDPSREATPPGVEWQHLETSPGGSWGMDVSAALDGSLVAAGWIAMGQGQRTDGLIRRLEGDGTTRWSKTFGGPRMDQLKSVLESSSGDLVAGGTTRSQGETRDQDGWLLRLNSEGETRWEHFYGGSGDDQLYRVTELRDGSLAAVGVTTTDTAGAEDLWLVLVDAEGSLLWERRWGGERSDWGYGVVESEEGLIVVGASASGERLDLEGWILHVDLAGDLLWQRVLGETGSDELMDVVSSGNSFFAAGHTAAAGELGQFWLVRFGPEGTIDWQRQYGGPYLDMAMALAINPAGELLLAGGSTPARNALPDSWVLEVDTEGAILGQEIWGGPLSEVWHGVVWTQQDDAVVVGYGHLEGQEPKTLWVSRIKSLTAALGEAEP